MDVFISYSAHDEQLAMTACARLESAGFRCWIAKRDISAGRNWGEAIMDALGQARVMVLILSPHSNGSTQVEREVERAASRGLPIIPFRLANIKVSKAMELFISSAHWLDAFEPPVERHFTSLVKAVQEIFGGAPRKPPEPAVPSAAEPLKLVLVYKRGAAKDERVLDLLDQRLRAMGHAVFIDRRMAIGVAWAQEIEQQIRESDVLIAILSEASVHSEMVCYEVQVAHSVAQQRGGKPRILPVRVDYSGPLPAELASVLERLQYFLWQSASDDDRLASEIMSALASPPRPIIDAGKLEAVGGAVPLDSTFYLVRPTDEELLSAVTRGDAIVLLKGARQMGKTSLLARGLQIARKSGVKVAFTDLQKLNGEQLASAESFYVGMGELLADQLEVDAFPRDTWNPKRSPNVNFDRFIRREILGRLDSRVIWALDEVDRLFTCAYGTEVFALFRTWHNERALDPGGPWSRLTLAIAYATEAHLFITDVNQSPFNVGTRIALQDFTVEQVAELNARYGSPLRGGAEVSRLYRLIGGQPFLVRRALHEMASRAIGIGDLEALADKDEGPFGDHLRRMLVMLAKDAALCDVVRGVLDGKPCPAPESFYRLRSAGVISGISASDSAPRCQLYRQYLRRHLL